MSKLIPFLVAGVGASSVSVGGVFMLKKTGGGSGVGNTNDGTNQPTTGQSGTDVSGQNSQAAQKISSDLGFTDLAGFKQNKGGKCVEEYVPGFTLPASSESSAETIDSSYFNHEGNVQSCLVINWERKEASTDPSPKKWTGNFQWLWTLVKGNKGMVAFAAYKPHSTEDKKISVEWGLYAVEQTSGSSTWTIKKYSESTDTTKKSLGKDDFDNSFPKKEEGITNLTSATNKDYLGFMESKDDVDNVCKEGDDSSCQIDSSKIKKFKASWKWTTPSDATTSKSIDKWGKSLPTVMNNIFGSTWSGVFDTLKGSWESEELTEPTSSPA